MRRASITIPDDLEAELDAYLKTQEPAPDLTQLLQDALRRFLEEKNQNEMLAEREYRRAKGPLNISVAPQGTEEDDISVNHDHYLAMES